ncbi:S-methylmethionine-dependent homocysteine/selenocysteine methylase [Inquilinus ginsengisoli]|uniref:homocysteine S-methyltransferase family protein n=1 Tax=Inquilinus ginsengisoli TaxID=363840 RepID=UPI003D194647
MTKYRSDPPQLQGGLFLTDGGIETTLIFHEGLDLPYFAAFHILRDDSGRAALRRYYARYIEIARREDAGFILESPTWRASSDWGRKLGYSEEELARANRDSIALMRELRDEFETGLTPIVISGCVGPRGDGYDPGQVMRPEEAAAYHGSQIRTFGEAGVDMVTAITMTNANEAIGVTRAAREAGVPVAVSFTLETDGRLPTGQDLKEAIEEVDEATSGGPIYYMINCAHPTHFAAVLIVLDAWVERVRGVRANASRRSHQELDGAPDLDDGDPVELGRQYGDLLKRHPQINVLGGCCGTDHRHVEQIGMACKLVA